MKYFDDTGRCIPSEGMRVFGDKPSYYYVLHQPKIDYASILERNQKFNSVSSSLSVKVFEEKAKSMLEKIRANERYENLLKGTHLPFVFKSKNKKMDIGEELEQTLLPNLKESFIEKFPQHHFKATLQSNSKLPKHVTIHPDSNYQQLIDASEDGYVVGWYFPQAFQEYDVDSQRLQIKQLPKIDGLKMCLSGGKDICSSLIGIPELLISSESYAPILCLSSYIHEDPRLILLLKSYGPHMEFWCMSQMLTKNKKQVSEQWAGGISFFDSY